MAQESQSIFQYGVVSQKDQRSSLIIWAKEKRREKNF